MADIEKVIQGLDCRIGNIDFDCRKCEYYNKENVPAFCRFTDLLRDALELLKEYAEIKNGVAPELEGDPGNGYWNVCGECHVYLSGNETYCKCCGRKVLWDARQTEEH